jgi:hypothetical protein
MDQDDEGSGGRVALNPFQMVLEAKRNVAIAPSTLESQRRGFGFRAFREVAAY